MHLNSELLFHKYALPFFREGMKVLEIGPAGYPSAYQKIVDNPTITWHTIDFDNTTFIDNAVSELTYTLNNPYSFPIDDNSYDVVLSGQVIEHVEKIYEPMLVNSIPIYWGNPLVDRDFNEGSFVNVHHYTSFEEVIEHIIKIDQDEDLYRSYLAADYFYSSVVPEYLRKENILKKFDSIFESIGKVKPVASTVKGQLSIYSRKVNPYIRKAKRILKLTEDDSWFR